MRYFVQLDGNKIQGIFRASMLSEDQEKEKLNDGYIELDEEQGILLNIEIPQKYVKGKVVTDDTAKEKNDRIAEINNEISNLMSQLQATDYVVIKIAEGVATKEDYTDILKFRAECRDKINKLEMEICNG